MKRRFRRVAMVAGVAVLIMVVPWVASAQSEMQIVLTERMQLTSFDPATGEGTQAGTFVSAGAINDAGTGTAEFAVTPAEHNTGHLRGTHVLVSAVGSLTIETEAMVVPFPPPTPPRVYAIGHWRTVEGTGTYAGVEGRGTVVATADFTTGQITIARVGMIRR